MPGLQEDIERQLDSTAEQARERVESYDKALEAFEELFDAPTLTMQRVEDPHEERTVLTRTPWLEREDGAELRFVREEFDTTPSPEPTSTAHTTGMFRFLRSPKPEPEAPAEPKLPRDDSALKVWEYRVEFRLDKLRGGTGRPSEFAKLDLTKASRQIKYDVYDEDDDKIQFSNEALAKRDSDVVDMTRRAKDTLALGETRLVPGESPMQKMFGRAVNWLSVVESQDTTGAPEEVREDKLSVIKYLGEKVANRDLDTVLLLSEMEQAAVDTARRTQAKDVSEEETGSDVRRVQFGSITTLLTGYADFS